MNKELNIGDYVKTKRGIAKIIGKRDDMRLLYPNAWVTDTYLEINDDTEYIYEENIIKSSPNIIDLIEVGDLIKLKPTKQIQQVLAKNEEEIDLTDYVFYDLKNSNVVEEIEWVITREQIEQMKYKVGD